MAAEGAVSIDSLITGLSVVALFFGACWWYASALERQVAARTRKGDPVYVYPQVRRIR